MQLFHLTTYAIFLLGELGRGYELGTVHLNPGCEMKLGLEELPRRVCFMHMHMATSIEMKCFHGVRCRGCNR